VCLGLTAYHHLKATESCRMWKNTGRPKSGPIYTQYKKTNYYRYIKSVFMKSRSRLLRPVILPCMTYMNDNWICSKLLKQVTASPQQSANNLNKPVRSLCSTLKGPITIAIRARFEYDTSTTRYNTLRGFSCARIRDWFEHSTRISSRRVLHVDWQLNAHNFYFLLI